MTGKQRTFSSLVRSTLELSVSAQWKTILLTFWKKSKRGNNDLNIQTSLPDALQGLKFIQKKNSQCFFDEKNVRVILKVGSKPWRRLTLGGRLWLTINTQSLVLTQELCLLVRFLHLYVMWLQDYFCSCLDFSWSCVCWPPRAIYCFLWSNFYTLTAHFMSKGKQNDAGENTKNTLMHTYLQRALTGMSTHWRPSNPHL